MFRHARTAARTAAIALTSGALALGAVSVAVASSAGAATPPIGGTVSYATEDTWHHVISVSGLAFDRRNQHKSLHVTIFADGRYAGQLTAGTASPAWGRAHHIAGKHAFHALLHVRGTVRRLVVIPSGRRTDGLARTVRHIVPAPGSRIVEVAKRYVGNTRYVEGGSTPQRGFDCSGYTRWAYQHASVATLPHNAEGQRHVRGMHRISQSAARPGDLVFYFAGGSAFHVAIYAGRGMQYAAATPRDGVRYQKIWSRNVEFRTLTH